MTSSTAGVSLVTQLCTSQDYWMRSLELLLPPVAALLSATALWVAARARSTFKDEQRMLSSLVASVQRSEPPPEPNESPPRARDRKKS